MPFNVKWLKETCINHVEGDAFMIWCSAERKWVNRIRKFAVKHPDLVEITSDDGVVVVAKVSYSWFRAPLPKMPRAREPMSEENRKAAGERLAAWREGKKPQQNSVLDSDDLRA